MPSFERTRTGILRDRLGGGDHARRYEVVKRTLQWIGRLAILLSAGFMGGVVGRNYPRDVRVHAQDKPSGTLTCSVTVPKSWGEYKGASAYGLAFQDLNGTLRFLLHPSCGNLSGSYSDYSGADLELQRR